MVAYAEHFRGIVPFERQHWNPIVNQFSLRRSDQCRCGPVVDKRKLQHVSNVGLEQTGQRKVRSCVTIRRPNHHLRGNSAEIVQLPP